MFSFYNEETTALNRYEPSILCIKINTIKTGLQIQVEIERKILEMVSQHIKKKSFLDQAGKRERQTTEHPKNT